MHRSCKATFTFVLQHCLQHRGYDTSVVKGMTTVAYLTVSNNFEEL